MCSSAIRLMLFASCFRRSWLSGGIGIRSMVPSEAGFRSRSAARIALSIAGNRFRSQGCTVMVLASGVFRVATWFSGMSCP